MENPDSKVHGANMGPIWGRQDPGGPHVGPMNFDIWEYMWNAVVSFYLIPKNAHIRQSISRLWRGYQISAIPGNLEPLGSGNGLKSAII